MWKEPDEEAGSGVRITGFPEEVSGIPSSKVRATSGKAVRDPRKGLIESPIRRLTSGAW